MGDHHYFVEVKAEGATTIRSNPATVTVEGVVVPPNGTERYKTVPYNPADFPQAQALASGRTRAEGVEENVLVFSMRDMTNNYYVYYGGRIEHTPLLYQQAIYYNGTTPITVGYSKSTSVETSVTHGIEKATTESVETTNTLGLTVGVSATVGFGGSGVSVSTEIETSVSEMLGRSVSTTSTFETTEGLVEGETFSTEATVGTNNEPVGMYRYALFATADVFYNVTYNRATKKITTLTVSLCARGSTYWGIDYDPELGGAATFGKTGSGEVLSIPEFDENNMPEVEIVPSPGTEVRVDNIIWAGANLGETSGTFAADAAQGGEAAYGGHYQFNSKVGWPQSGVAVGFDTSERNYTSWPWENDPCPQGWRVPTEEEWRNLAEIRRVGDAQMGVGNTVVWWYVLSNEGGYGTTIHMPIAGRRSQGSGSEMQRQYGWYWTAHASPNNASIGLATSYTKALFTAAPNMNARSLEQYMGASIRCVRPAEN